MKFGITGSFIIFILLLMMSGRVFAAELDTITTNKFLSTSYSDYSLESQREVLEYLENSTSSTPYMDKIEFRTFSKDFEISKQKYALRFYPKGWSETKYNNLLTASIMDAYSVEHQVYFNKALLRRYRLILDFLETTEQLRVTQELQDVFDDRLSVLRQQTGTLAFDVGEYIQAENKYTNLQLDLVKLKNKLTGIVHKIHIAADSISEISFDSDGLVDIEDIVREIDSLKLNPDSDNIYLKDRKNKIERAKIKYNIEKAQERDYLSFFQLEYDRDNYNKKNKKAYSFDIGFRLPFINSDRENINRRRVNYIEEKLKYEGEKRATSERIESNIRSLSRLINQYRIVTDKKANSDARSPLEAYMKMEGINPLSLLEIRESIINNDRQQSQIFYSILFNYVELMDLVGKLSEKPLKNYISKGMEIVDEE